MTQFEVEGLEAPAEIVVDRWGIPHIRANTRRDVFFVQGFNAGRDRLWQLDLWRKRGLGRLAADFGPGFLAQDRAARLFLYRGDMETEWAAYGTPETRDIVTAFVEGLNAWIGLCEGQPELLAPEFGVMGTRPERWKPEEMLRIRSHALVRNALWEVARAQVMARGGDDRARKGLEPEWVPVVPEGLDLTDITPEILDVFRLAVVAPDFSPERLAAGIEDAWKWCKVNELGDVYTQGSNNWAVSGSRTATGRPVLASDPHRAHALPSLRYIVHLSGPGIDAIGAGEPAVPGISFGHNGTAAFGLTIFPMDQEDLYVYETHPDDPELYRYEGRWERMVVRTELVCVKGATDQEITLKYTRHGPVVFEDTARRRAFAIKSVWAEPGTFAYFASLATMQAKTPAEYEAALEYWGAPSINHAYADTAGNIAWFASGRVPVRRTWDGLLPVPGDGRYEWEGFHPLSALPKAVNPARGFIATANEMNLPADYPIYERRIGFEWAERSRTTRIHAVLDGQPAHTVADSQALQTDSTSLPAQRLVGLLSGLSLAGDAAVGRAVFDGWDFALRRESAAGALAEVWWVKHLKPALLDRIAGGDKVVRALLVPGDNATLVPMLTPDDPLLAPTLSAAVADMRARQGDDPSGWQWGKLHHGYFEHVLSPVSDFVRDVGPVAKGGSGSTPMAAGYRPSDFRVTTGASFRMVVDVGAWDNSVCINAPGQSGDARSPHYDDLAPLWGAEQYVPMLYSREAVDAAASEVITLVPHGK
jgi:penicillin amidase